MVLNISFDVDKMEKFRSIEENVFKKINKRKNLDCGFLKIAIAAATSFRYSANKQKDHVL